MNPRNSVLGIQNALLHHKDMSRITNIFLPKCMQSQSYWNVVSHGPQCIALAISGLTIDGHRAGYLGILNKASASKALSLFIINFGIMAMWIQYDARGALHALAYTLTVVDEYMNEVRLNSTLSDWVPTFEYIRLRIANCLAAVRGDYKAIFHPVDVEVDELFLEFDLRMRTHLGSNWALCSISSVGLREACVSLQAALGVHVKPPWWTNTGPDQEARQRFFADPKNPMWERLNSEKSDELPGVYERLESCGREIYRIARHTQGAAESLENAKKQLQPNMPKPSFEPKPTFHASAPEHRPQHGAYLGTLGKSTQEQTTIDPLYSSLSRRRYAQDQGSFSA
ncbi:hypothetical protein P154DRAFT_361849 [Amniculicola lignicola CBS 123094]|uniref:Uncharacterized protein n=1 Tax=Amniculicola lignicola CBS 123094 TaxID=1392246 RepID=A0A6A5WBF2_9PLEO|nr:hypothetical protein P154DRAFT_361849 [Amniculicola lignicola CBS 123094]